VGPRAGQKLFTLQLLPAGPPEEAGDPSGAVRAGGFSLHAGVAIAPHQRGKLERLCRYVSRPPVACERLALTPTGQVRYTLKTPYRDGTTHIVLEPLDLMARLAALVPPPRMHLTRYHGVFAPHSKLRAAVTPAHRGLGAAKQPPAGSAKPPTPRHVAMDWARRLKRVFGIEIEDCARCGGKLKVIATSRSRRSSRRSSRTWSARRRSRTRPRCRSGRGRRRCRPGCCELAGDGQLRWPLTRPAATDRCLNSGQGRGRAESGCGPGHLPPAGGPARLAGGRVCRARLVNARLALTVSPVTRTRIGLDRWFEFPIRCRPHHRK